MMNDSAYKNVESLGIYVFRNGFSYIKQTFYREEEFAYERERS